MIDAETAEHEACHGILAIHFGVRVTELRADTPTTGVAGWCDFDEAGWFPEDRWGGMSLEWLATIVAPERWFARFRRREHPRPSGFGPDRAAFDQVMAATTPAETRFRMEMCRRAERLADQVLQQRRDDVLTIAAKLRQHGAWRQGHGWGQPPRPPMTVRAANSARVEEGFPYRRPTRHKPTPAAPRSPLSPDEHHPGTGRTPGDQPSSTPQGPADRRSTADISRPQLP